MFIAVAVALVQVNSSLEEEIDDDDKIARGDIIIITFRVALTAPAKPRGRSRLLHGVIFFARIDCQRGSSR